MGSRDAVCSEYQGRTFFVFLSSRRADRDVEMLVKMHDGFVISQNVQWECGLFRLSLDIPLNHKNLVHFDSDKN